MAKRKPRPTAMWRYETHGQKRGDTTHQELGPAKPSTVAMMRDFVAGYAPEATLRVFQAEIIWTELDPVTLEPLEPTPTREDTP
jgi:hypothetical protein